MVVAVLWGNLSLWAHLLLAVQDGDDNKTATRRGEIIQGIQDGDDKTATRRVRSCGNVPKYKWGNQSCGDLLASREILSVLNIALLDFIFS